LDEGDMPADILPSVILRASEADVDEQSFHASRRGRWRIDQDLGGEGEAFRAQDLQEDTPDLEIRDSELLAFYGVPECSELACDVFRCAAVLLTSSRASADVASQRNDMGICRLARDCRGLLGEEEACASYQRDAQEEAPENPMH